MIAEWIALTLESGPPKARTLESGVNFSLLSEPSIQVLSRLNDGSRSWRNLAENLRRRLAKIACFESLNHCSQRSFTGHVADKEENSVHGCKMMQSEAETPFI